GAGDASRTAAGPRELFELCAGGACSCRRHVVGIGYRRTSSAHGFRWRRIILFRKGFAHGSAPACGHVACSSVWAEVQTMSTTAWIVVLVLLALLLGGGGAF